MTMHHAARQAQEAHRQANGRFGTQPHGTPAGPLMPDSNVTKEQDHRAEDHYEIAMTSTDPDEIDQIAASGGHFARAAMRNPILRNTSAITLLRNDDSHAMTIALASRRHITPEVAQTAWTEGDEYRRRSLLAHRDCPPRILQAAGMSHDPEERLQVALWADHAPRETITRLAYDDDPRIVRAAAGNPAMPANELEELAKHTDRRVRVNVAANENTLENTLHRLEHDHHPDVRAAATRSLDYYYGRTPLA